MKPGDAIVPEVAWLTLKSDVLIDPNEHDRPSPAEGLKKRASLETTHLKQPTAGTRRVAARYDSG